MGALVSAIFYRHKSVWLYSASVVSLVVGLICSESVHFRGFWPEFGAVLSLGLLLTSLIYSVDERAAEGGSREQERGRKITQ